MLLRSLLLLCVCLAASRLLAALPLEVEHQETLLDQESDQLPLESTNDAVVREKRTIGFLRQAFPTLSQIIDRKIQSITRLLFRLIGRLVLRGGGGGGGGGGGDSGDEERRVQITLPTFPPSEDEDEDEDEDSTGGSVDADSGSDSDATTTTTEPSAEENDLSRKKRQAEAAPAEDEEYEDDDQAAAATGDNEVVSSAEEEGDDTESAESEDDPRNKRFSGGLGGDGGAGASGGGSGNFLFDIIRLVAGSGATQTQDEAENAPLDDTNTTHTVAKGDDGYGAGVPGPLTRLFVIANRGIANLIQDLILRLAQTSERIVNFKARLITSII